MAKKEKKMPKNPEKTKKIRISVFRYDPSTTPEGHYQDFTVDAPAHFTLLDTLIQIKDHVDGSITFRRNCKNAICGSCTMRVNGQAVLACKEHIHDLDERYGGRLEIAPMGNMSVIKDLVTDMHPFWEQYKAVQPWLIRKREEPAQEYREYIMAPEDRETLVQMADCIQCGACYSDCNTIQVEPRFIGPAALAKAWRFVADSRDEGGKERLSVYEKPHGHWDCTHCFACVEVCPMDVAPMDQILNLRNAAIKAGYKSAGQRHHDAFVDSVCTSGRLNELTLPLKSKGLDVIGQLELVLAGLRMAAHGKMPPLRHEKMKEIPEIRRITDRARGDGHE